MVICFPLTYLYIFHLFVCFLWSLLSHLITWVGQLVSYGKFLSPPDEDLRYCLISMLQMDNTVLSEHLHRPDRAESEVSSPDFSGGPMAISNWPGGAQFLYLCYLLFSLWPQVPLVVSSLIVNVVRLCTYPQVHFGKVHPFTIPFAKF